MIAPKPLTRFFSNYAAADFPVTYDVTKQLICSEEKGSNATVESVIVESISPRKTLIEGDIYQKKSEFVLNVFRWPTTCNEQTFFAALQEMLLIENSVPVSNTALSITAVSRYADVVPDGVLVFTNHNLSTIPLEEVLEPFAKGNKNIRDITQAVNSIRDSAEQVEIQALRVVTPFADFQLDIKSDDGAGGVREVAVLSRFNLAEQTAYLRALTGTNEVAPSHFSQALQQLTGVFPRYHPGAETSALVM